MAIAKIWLGIVLLAVIFIFTAEIAQFPKAFAAEPRIIITEIMYDPGTPQSNREWVEIYNNSEAGIDLTNWKFSDGTNHYLFFETEDGETLSYLESSEYAVLASDIGSFRKDYPNFSKIIIDTTMTLTDSGKILTIIDDKGSVVNSVDYRGKSSPAGRSLERDNDNLWYSSLVNGGTPGEEGSLEKFLEETESQNFLKPLSPALGKEFIGENEINFSWEDDFSCSSCRYDILVSKDQNSFNLLNDEPIKEKSLSSTLENGNYFWKIQRILPMYNQDGSTNFIIEESDIYNFSISPIQYSSDIIINELFPNPTTGSNNEFIEIFNRGNIKINLSGWWLTDGVTKYYFPRDTEILPGQYLVIYKPESKISLNNDGDEISLFSGQKLVSIVNYDTADQDFSYSLDNNKWQWTSLSTPGTINIIRLPTEAEELKPINSEPIEIKTGEAKNYLNYLVKIEGTVVANYATVFYLDDGSGRIKIYLLKGVNIDKSKVKKGLKVSLIGVIEEFEGVYRLVLRRQEDLVILSTSIQTSTKTLKEKTTALGAKLASNLSLDGLGSIAPSQVKGITYLALQKTKNMVKLVEGILILTLVFLGLILVEWRWSLLAKTKHRPERLPGNSP